MKKICIVLMIFIIAIGLTGCSDEYLSVVQDRVEENQEVARLTMESDHLIRGYMVSQEGIAVKVVQILEFSYNGDPYRVLVEMDPFEGTFLGFENLSGQDDEAIQDWHDRLMEWAPSENLLTANDTDLASLWFAAVVEAQENFLFLTEDQ